MICEAERGTCSSLIARYKREILGVSTVYELKSADNGEDLISVTRGGEEGSAAVGCDFFCAAELFRDVVITYTLPENMVDIECDFLNREIL